MFNAQTSNTFWVKQIDYPNYGPIRQRWAHDLQTVIQFVDRADTLSDIGCGTGVLSGMLCVACGFTVVHLYDIAPNLLLQAYGNMPNKVKCLPCLADWDQIPECSTDVCIMMGVTPYMSDSQLMALLGKIQSHTLILRAPCASNRQEIDTYSQNLGDNYSAIYRTRQEMIDFLFPAFKILDVDYSWPEDIDSKFGTRQSTFVCRHW